MKTLNEKGKRIAFPETALIMFLLIFFMGVMTYIMPAGSFDHVIESDREITVAGSYHAVEQSPISIMSLLSSIYNGIIEASDIIAFLIVVGGAFGIVTRSGAITVSLNKLVNRLKGRESIVIAVIMTVLAIGGATFGLSEETVPFLVIMIIMALKMGFDPITGVAIICFGVYSGYAPGPLNPFNTGIAQGIAHLPLFSGIGLRIVAMVGSLAISITMVTIHAKKYKKEGHDNTKLLESLAKSDIEKAVMSKRDVIILFVLLATIIALISGVLIFNWYLAQFTALFFIMGIIVGVISREGNLNQITRDFIDGIGDMTSAILYVSLGSAVVVVMKDGMIMDTLVYYLSLPLSHLSNLFAAWGTYITQGIINLFVPSSSGQAAIVMPILTPLADIIGISRQTTVLAYQLGDGFWNMLTPLDFIMMTGIGIGKVSFGKWFKFAVKLVAALSVWVFIVLAIAIMINYN